MSEKSINYMARDFNTIKSELLALSKQYYPELSDTFNDASVGAWLIDLVSAVGDDLNYYIDRCYNEQNVNTASLKSSVLNTARANNFKVPGPKAAMCEVAISIDLPVNNSASMSLPNWEMAPRIKQGAVVTNGSIEFETLEDIDFKEQFNKNALSNRSFLPVRNASGAIVRYRVTKTVLASAGRSRIYKKLLTMNDIKPFMEILIPFKNVMAIEGVIFKATSDLSIQPSLYEFNIDAERFQIQGEDVDTYRYFEVDSLADQYRFGDSVDTVVSMFTQNPSEEVVARDNDGNTTVQYAKGQWIPITQKYVAEYTDTGYIKLIFGSGTDALVLDESSDATAYAKNQLTKIANNNLTGVLPKANWVMYVLYRDGGGQMANVAPNSLTKLGVAQWEWRDTKEIPIADIKNSVRVKNISQGVAGIDAPSVEEVKYLTRYNNSAQERCVTLKDYELRVKMMPSKYGAPYRCKAIEDNNKVLIYMLGINSDGTLTSELSSDMTENIVEYLKYYKSLGDLVELRSAKIFNIQVAVYASISKTYNKQSVIKAIISTVNNFFATSDHNLGDDLYIGDLEKQISSIDGVVNFEKIFVYTISGGGKYSSTMAPVPIVAEEGVRGSDGSQRYQIDLDAMKKVLTCDAKGMFEIKDFTSDITVKVRTV